MTFRRLPWLIAFPLMAAGVLGAHGVATPLRGVPAAEGGAAHEAAERSGHTVTATIPLWAGLVLACALVLAGAWSVLALRGRSRRGVGPWAFALLPPLAFVLVEAFERVIDVESFPFDAGLEPGLLLGLALQVPFGALAYGVARLLLRVVRRIGTVLRATELRAPAEPSVARFDLRRVAPARLAPLSLGYGERGPPGQCLPI